MPQIKIRTHIYNITPTRDSYNRRATQYHNFIIEKLRQFGVREEQYELSEERVAMKKAPASASWWMDDTHCNFSYNKMSKFVDNMLVVWKVIERHIEMVYAGELSKEEFLNIFKEDDDVDEKRTAAREFFGLDENHVDLESVSKQYKILAKTLHPDMPTGDIDKFKELNMHHKTLKRELE